MTDIVVRCELKDEAESEAFGAYLSRFVEAAASEIAAIADRLEAPFLMVRSEPQVHGDLRVVTFQEADTARDFTAGWRRARPPRLDA